MCGFVLMVSKQDRPVQPRVVARMSDDIVHRGPDDTGQWLSDWCGIGFRRLSILDLSARGHQPMTDATGRFVIAYNGELYNFAALRRELASGGVTFTSTSDTEVVLNSFIRWGPACLDRFIGMFAFAIVNVATREVFVARDHLGIKPLYHTEDDDYFYLASEIKAFRNVVTFELNHDVLYEQLVFRYVAGTNTPFENVHKFPAGAHWTIRRGAGFEPHSYYDIVESLRPSRAAIAESTTLSDIEASLTDSIRLHTASDVGYSVQLSGGVDSSFITAVLARESGKRLDTFSVALNDRRFDESEYQRLVAQAFGTHHHEFVLGGSEFGDALEAATWHMDVPIVHLGCVMLMLLCQHAVSSSKVILTGEGADELFAGYSRYLDLTDAPWRPGGKVASLLRAMRIDQRWVPGSRPFGKYKAQLASKVTDASRTLKRPTMESFLRDIPESIPYRDAIVTRQPTPVLQSLAHDQVCYLESLLDRQDKMSMAASVEARVPFCNPRLFDLVNPIPSTLKLKNGEPKYLLKKIAEKYLDHRLLYRRKNGLRLPVDEWLQEEPMAGYMTLLNDETARSRGFYDSRMIDRAIREFRRGKTIWGRYLVSLITFEIWMRMFIDDHARQAASAAPVIGQDVDRTWVPSETRTS